MKKSIALVLCASLILLSACNSNSLEAKALKNVRQVKSSTPTGNLVAEVSTPVVQAAPEAPSDDRSAAEVLQEFKNQEQISAVPSEGSSIYAGTTSSKTGVDALKERMKALYSQSATVGSVDADTEFGAKYHDSDGDPTNLPDGYSDNDGN